jgi:hypothetical protein
MAAADWDAVAGAAPVILWILFLALKKRKQRGERPKTDAPAPPERKGRRRRDESPLFERNYDPIEPS